MLRRLPTFLLVVAALLASEPLLHQHPLQANSDVEAAARSLCAVCATGVGRLPLVAPAVVAPEVNVYIYSSREVPVATFDAPLQLPSRAPPAA